MIDARELTSEHSQSPDIDCDADQGRPAAMEIGGLLKQLRGERTLRQVENDTGISNSYLSNLEMGRKNPGIRSLSRLASYYQVPLNDFLQCAGLPFDERAPALTGAPAMLKEVQRSYEFVLTDPHLEHYEKPSEKPSVDTQKFVVRLYEHYTGKKLL